MTDLNTDLINQHAAQARGFLANDPDVDQDAGYQAVQALADVDVPSLLLELERVTVSQDNSYVRGLKAAARCMAAFDQDVEGLDRFTCQQLAKAVQAMVDSAQQRLGVDGDGPAAEALAGFMAGSPYVGYAALREVQERGNLRHSLNEMIGAADRVAQGLATTGSPTDRPLLPVEREAFEQGWAATRANATGTR